MEKIYKKEQAGAANASAYFCEKRDYSIKDNLRSGGLKKHM